MIYLSGLPRALFEDVCLNVHAQAMQDLALFEGCDKTMITYLTTRLRFELYLPGEAIFRIGDIGRSLYRIMKVLPLDLVKGAYFWLLGECCCAQFRV